VEINGHDLTVIELFRIGSDIKKTYTVIGVYKCGKCRKCYRIDTEIVDGKEKEILNEAREDQCVEK
jgi:hypothetical protein